MERGLAFAGTLIRGLDRLAPVLDLTIRVFVASAFFQRGLTLLAAGNRAQALVEFAFAPLLVLGLGTRAVALLLLVLQAGGDAAIALLLLASLVRGPGALSLDHLIGRRFRGGGDRR
jgi:uncharacterized membrane protein YphA (DoxX/SURF4 family)